MSDNILDLLEKYQLELKNDITIDDLNMKDRSMVITAIKHKWVGYLMRHKIDLKKLENGRELMVNTISEQLLEKPDIQISHAAIRRKAESHETIIKVDEQIEGYKIIIEYLEKVEKVVNSMTWDLKNIIELVKMETQ